MDQKPFPVGDAAFVNIWLQSVGASITDPDERKKFVDKFSIPGAQGSLVRSQPFGALVMA